MGSWLKSNLLQFLCLFHFHSYLFFLSVQAAGLNVLIIWLFFYECLRCCCCCLFIFWLLFPSRTNIRMGGEDSCSYNYNRGDVVTEVTLNKRNLSTVLLFTSIHFTSIQFNSLLFSSLLFSSLLFSSLLFSSLLFSSLLFSSLLFSSLLFISTLSSLLKFISHLFCSICHFVCSHNFVLFCLCCFSLFLFFTSSLLLAYFEFISLFCSVHFISVHFCWIISLRFCFGLFCLCRFTFFCSSLLHFHSLLVTSFKFISPIFFFCFTSLFFA